MRRQKDSPDTRTELGRIQPSGYEVEVGRFYVGRFIRLAQQEVEWLGSENVSARSSELRPAFLPHEMGRLT